MLTFYGSHISKRDQLLDDNITYVYELGNSGLSKVTN